MRGSCFKVVLSVAWLGISLAWAQADTVSAARDLITRVVPAQAGAFVVETIPAENGQDVFEIDSRDGKIVLRGNNGVSLASALKRYLADYCHADPGWQCGSQMNLPATLPLVSAKLHVVSPYQYRFDYNYCTHGYTFAWWDWPRWERELDDLAMHGVNLALIIEGQEQVWIDALHSFGYTDAEVRKWLVMPSHQPWQFMSNMEDYGGPVPESIVSRRLELGKKIITRMRELGMEPVQQGYYGIVPSDFHKRFPEAKVHAQGMWGTMKRPDMLDPADPQFAKFAAVFYDSQKKYFGNAKFLAADPFHEGGKTDGIDLAACAREMYAPMSNAYASVTWVFQSWQANPRQQMLNALDKSKCLVLDLYCEDHENWRSRNQFGDTPWIWGTIHNFGGNDFIASKLAWMAEGPSKALAEAGPGRGYMRGIGGLMEGSDTHPAVWEMIFGQTWRTNAPDFNEWLNDYERCRYGAQDVSARQALQTLFDSAWNVDHKSGPKMVHHNSVICGRPSLNPAQRASPSTGTTPPYDETQVVAAWKQLLEGASACGASDGYRYDVADIGREVMADLGTHYHQAIIRAFQAKDAKKLRELSDKMLGLFRDMDELTGTRKEFLLGAWVADARNWGVTPDEKNLCEWNARALLTDWTVPECWTDYANRQWNGLLGDFYYTRWKMWLDALNEAVDQDGQFNQGPVRKKIQDWEYAWTRETKTYPSQPSGDTVAIAKRLLAKYAADATDADLIKGPMFKNATAQDFMGHWQYRAEGAMWERVFTPDGSAKLYRNGQSQDWNGFTWSFDKGAIVLKRADGSVFERQVLQDHNTMLFTMGGFEPARRMAANTNN